MLLGRKMLKTTVRYIITIKNIRELKDLQDHSNDSILSKHLFDKKFQELFYSEHRGFLMIAKSLIRQMKLKKLEKDDLDQTIMEALLKALKNFNKLRTLNIEEFIKGYFRNELRKILKESKKLKNNIEYDDTKFGIDDLFYSEGIELITLLDMLPDYQKIIVINLLRGFTLSKISKELKKHRTQIQREFQDTLDNINLILEQLNKEKDAK
jgi:AraC-like DNA-binding protein